MARIWARVEKGSDTECWEWRGAKNKGHGVIRMYGTQQRVHRLVYESEVGPIQRDFDIHHVCENRACVNPAHLQALSRRDHALASPRNPVGANAHKTHCPQGHPYSGDNLRINASGRRVCRECERAAALRWKYKHLPMCGNLRGSEHHHATLTEADVLAIRAAAASGVRQRRLAEQYGVGPMQISRIVNRQQWTHI